MSRAIEPDPSSPGAHDPNADRLGGKLVKSGLISANQLRHALELQDRKGGRIADILIHLGALDSYRFLEFLAKQPGTPSISLKHCRIQEDIISMVPIEFCQSNELIPIDRMGKLLTVGMVCPLDRVAIEALQEMTGLRVKPMLCSRNEVKDAIQRYYVGLKL